MILLLCIFFATPTKILLVVGCYGVVVRYGIGRGRVAVARSPRRLRCDGVVGQGHWHLVIRVEIQI